MNHDSEYNPYDEMVEIALPTADSFRLIRETLTRIGIANSRTRTLWQSCHILSKGGRYYITHFKTLMSLDGQAAALDEEDQERVWDIAWLLDSWGLCNIQAIDVPHPGKNLFRIIKAREREDWTLVPKYTLGTKYH